VSEKNATPDQAGAENRKARFQLPIEDTIETGIALNRLEVKSRSANGRPRSRILCSDPRTLIWLITTPNTPIPGSQPLQPWRSQTPAQLAAAPDAINSYGAVDRDGMTLMSAKTLFQRARACQLLAGGCQGQKLHDNARSVNKMRLGGVVKKVACCGEGIKDLGLPMVRGGASAPPHHEVRSGCEAN